MRSLKNEFPDMRATPAEVYREARDFYFLNHKSQTHEMAERDWIVFYLSSVLSKSNKEVTSTVNVHPTYICRIYQRIEEMLGSDRVDVLQKNRYKPIFSGDSKFDLYLSPVEIEASPYDLKSYSEDYNRKFIEWSWSYFSERDNALGIHLYKRVKLDNDTDGFKKSVDHSGLNADQVVQAIKNVGITLGALHKKYSKIHAHGTDPYFFTPTI